MSEYRKLTPPEKRALRAFMLKTFKKHNIKKLNGKTVPSNKVPILIEEFEKEFKTNPIASFLNRLEKTVSCEKGYVYVIGNEEAKICKIGFSANPNKRIKEVQTGCPYLLKILLIFQADKYTETRLHHKYSKYRRNGEWFNIAGELKSSIDKHLKLQPIYV